MGTCLYCKKLFVGNATGRPKKYCDAECRHKHKHQLKYKQVEKRKTTSLECSFCKEMFEAKKTNAKYCSRRCFYQSKKDDWKKEFICQWCNTPFKSANKEVKFCSTKCVGEFQRIEAIEKAKKTMPRNHFRSRRARTEYLRRKRVRDNFVEHVDINVLIERDKGICQLCKEPVNLDVDYLDLSAPTRDHIIALANGGEHSYTNTQLAHRLCNAIKNDHINFGGEEIAKTKQKRESLTSKITN